MKISEIYDILCELYGIGERLDIERFVCSSPWGSADAVVGHAHPGREALFLRQRGETLELALFVEPSILAAIEEGDGLDHVDEFACAAEGVSHFLYVVERTRRGGRVSCLELELQAEVDKFLLLQLSAAARAPGLSSELFERQFVRYAFDANLGAEERERYATASYFAAKYCARLRRSFFHPLRRCSLIAEARSFFRRDLAAKLALVIP